ncbi:imidazole glycerol phosphate synthase subunit HisH [Kangiella sp. HZ709]|uniref:imidazole glycerol phosphate synthase subunit HisH n=1 Tax=Kangiella sp. HZ709 TaxID=2666328 RepID=UPI0012AF8A1F|nr:imidazole glycerol phosphate synthase subunit HisH [Kangiella sp. HZ709]MRX28382.1 imidazole glycerol phosphate synthase subunit HisH [Kangiella sp. HZ709]
MSPLKKVAVIDTGAGNLFSLFACLERIEVEAELVTSAEQLDDTIYQTLLIPGQGRFGNVMENLNQSGLSEAIKAWYLKGKNIIGICVGLQIFFESSEEDEGIAGLSLLKGQVSKLNSPKQPMVGWCSLQSSSSSLNGKSVYFVNSYAVKNSVNVTSKVSYGEDFVASIASNGLTAFQFHPEKSGKQGEEILRRCLG